MDGGREIKNTEFHTNTNSSYGLVEIKSVAFEDKMHGFESGSTPMRHYLILHVLVFSSVK